MTPDEMEAENRKYLNEVVMALRLKSGLWAIFNSHRKLQFIVPESGMLQAIINVTHEPYVTWTEPEPPIDVSIDLSKFNL